MIGANFSKMTATLWRLLEHSKHIINYVIHLSPQEARINISLNYCFIHPRLLLYSQTTVGVAISERCDCQIFAIFIKSMSTIQWGIIRTHFYPISLFGSDRLIGMARLTPFHRDYLPLKYAIMKMRKDFCYIIINFWICINWNLCQNFFHIKIGKVSV